MYFYIPKPELFIRKLLNLEYFFIEIWKRFKVKEKLLTGIATRVIIVLLYCESSLVYFSHTHLKLNKFRV